MYRPGRSARLIAQRKDTAIEIAGIITLAYETAVEKLKSVGLDPYRYLPEATTDNVMGYRFKSIRSDIRVDTASGRGVGRSDRIDDVYCTELVEWEHTIAEQAMANLITADPGSKGRVTVDFNADTNWMSSHAYEIWEQARKEHTDSDWNGFTPFFSGTDDLPEMYTPEFLQGKLRALNNNLRQFNLNYPRTPDDLYVQRDIAVHDAQLVDAAVTRTGGRYLCDVLTAGQLQGLRVVHCVDTAYGRDPTGQGDRDFHAVTSWGWHNAMWWELCPPIHTRAILQDELARQFFAGTLCKYGGTVIPERNIAESFTVELLRLMSENYGQMVRPATMYRHLHRDRAGKQMPQFGFPMTGDNSRSAKKGTKSMAIGELDAMLTNGELGIVTPELALEMKGVEWKYNEDGTPGSGLAGAPNRKSAHDDYWITAILLAAGQYGVSSGKMAA